MTIPRAAVLLLFEITPESIVEHDDWHTHEHMPERLRIPGFLRGSRWTSLAAAGRYCVLYELESVDALQSDIYRERLDNPTPWTSKMMRSYRGMHRTLCSIDARTGRGLGGVALVVPFAIESAQQDQVCARLSAKVMPALEHRRGFAQCYLLRSAASARPTAEQKIRGDDASLQSALIVTGYDPEALGSLSRQELAADRFSAAGARLLEHAVAMYRLAFSMSANE
jgi:hypothetical protein